MKHSFLFAGCLCASLILAACGGDSSSSSVDQDTDSSTSVDGTSSESEDELSSSSVYTDPNWPAGARAATLEDLSRNLIVKINKVSLHLGTGAKQGMFSLWGIDNLESTTNLAAILVLSDFKDGIIKMNSENTEVPLALTSSILSNKVLQDINNMPSKKSLTLSFIVVNEKLMYNVDGGDFVDVEIENLPIDKSVITKSENLDKKQLTCAGEKDTSIVFNFYNGRYVMERVVKNDIVSWNAGFMDTYRGYTFMLTKFNSGLDVRVITRKISSDYSTLGSMNCTSKDFKYSQVDPKSIMGSWATYDAKANMNWTLDLKKNMQYELQANVGADEYKGGYWDVYGDKLLMKISSLKDSDTRCSDKKPCAQSMIGTVSDVSETGFTFDHSNTDNPRVPTEWGIPEIE